MRSDLLRQSADILKNITDGYNAFQDLLRQVQGESADINQWDAEIESDEEMSAHESLEGDEYGMEVAEWGEEREDEIYTESHDECEPFYIEDLEPVIDSPILARGFYMGIPVSLYKDVVERGPVDTLLDSSSGLYRERE